MTSLKVTPPTGWRVVFWRYPGEVSHVTMVLVGTGKPVRTLCGTELGSMRKVSGERNGLWETACKGCSDVFDTLEAVYDAEWSEVAE